VCAGFQVLVVEGVEMELLLPLPVASHAVVVTLLLRMILPPSSLKESAAAVEEVQASAPEVPVLQDLLPAPATCR
jgi:hypothetical protein